MMIRILTVLLVCTGFLLARAQKKEELQKQNAQLQKEIAIINKNLAKARSESKLSLNLLNAVNQKIVLREKIYSNTQKEKKVIENEIYLRQLEINRQRRELEVLRKNYAKVLVNAYKNKGIQNKVLFILSSQNLGQAIRRIQYLKKYGEYQKRKSEQIMAAATALEQAVTQKKASMKEKDQLLITQSQELKKIGAEKQEKEVLIKEFKENETRLVAELQQKQAKSRELKAQISSIIREELRLAKAREEAERKAKAEQIRLAKIAAEKEKARIEAENRARAEALERQRREAEEAARKAAELAAKKREEEQRLASERSAREAAEARAKAQLAEQKAAQARAAEAEQTKRKEEQKKAAEAKVMTNYGVNSGSSASFAQSRGRIGFPVDGGSITHRFGRQPHPVFKNVTEENIGIKIATGPNARVKSVFPGVVSSILPQSDGTRTVMVRHGEYFTVYSNLGSTLVRAGQTVSAGTQLGTVGQDFDGAYTLEFQVWSGTTPVDPLGWISY